MKKNLTKKKKKTTTKDVLNFEIWRREGCVLARVAKGKLNYFINDNQSNQFKLKSWTQRGAGESDVSQSSVSPTGYDLAEYSITSLINICRMHYNLTFNCNEIRPLSDILQRYTFDSA